MKKIKQTGVTYVTKKAIEYGYSENNPEWINLGQGSQIRLKNRYQ